MTAIPLRQVEPGLEHLSNVRDLLTDEEREKLDADLAEMARQRRAAAAAAHFVVIG